jgi:hypothetical protein
MYPAGHEVKDKIKFWKTYFMTLVCFLVVGFIPSVAVVAKHGLGLILPPSEEDKKALAEMEEIASRFSWLTCPVSASRGYTSSRGMVIKSKCGYSENEIIMYYKENFRESGFSYDIENNSHGTVIKAKKDQISCEVTISGNDVRVVLSRLDL